MKAVGLLGLLCVSVAVAGDDFDVELDEPDPVPFDEGIMPIAVVEAARATAHLSIGERMKAISEPLLGLPYVIDGNGEGVAPDLDPPARYDVFDCLTFLEEILALALAADPLGAPQVRNSLRYRDGNVSYLDRHHFMLQEWIPKNIEAGWLRDITGTLGETHMIEKEVMRSTWTNWAGTRKFSLPVGRFPTGRYSLPVLSLDEAAAAVDRIPPGAVVFTVRRPMEWKPIVVSHVGFVIPSDEHPRMRHATKMNGGIIRDHYLAWYIDRMRWYAERPVEGITVLMPIEQGPRLSRLSAEASQ